MLRFQSNSESTHMTVFAVVNTKGGVGKSTIAVHLAAMLSEWNPTLLIDGDEQPSAASWSAWRAENSKIAFSPTTIQLTGKAIMSEGTNLSKSYANTVVDVGGRNTASLRAALLLADVAIVPTGTGAFDSAAMTDLLEIVELAKDFNTKLRVRMLLNRVDGRTKDDDDMRAHLENKGLDVLINQISERVAFDRAIKDGKTVHELGKDGMAITEINAFFLEVTA